MNSSPLYQQVETLPDLVSNLLFESANGSNLQHRINQAFPPELCRQLGRVYITGCGDSYHAALNAELAFEQFAGLPCEPQAAMQFSRYTTPFLTNNSDFIDLVIGVSVSGKVSRTIEAIELAKQAGILTVAVTGDQTAPLGRLVERVLDPQVPSLPPQQKGQIYPGARSYVASQLSLFLIAIHLGHQRGHLDAIVANKLRQELVEMADLMEQTIALCAAPAKEAAIAWRTAMNFVFCGSGPNLGTAAFSAAKMLEASGDEAIAQDMEEWAHLQYFAREEGTPTILISAAQRDADRTLEIATAATKIGRQVGFVAPESSKLAHSADKDFLFPLAGNTREAFSPLVACLPGLLFASYRTDLIGERYFRDFGGGRSIIGGGGISRIQTSHRLRTLSSLRQSEE
ncbi:MAG: SIS domain-containing protein [Candidatus Promineifilaceae bacterium]|nr:SIS domain-containing protein [Candidatus Promineifilaceae bacterium]